MNDNDIANQLRLQYRMMRFTCNTKWWWALWLWGFEVSLVNSYKMYQRHHKDQGWPVEFTHYKFIEAVAHAWIDPINCWPTRNRTTLKLLEKKLKRRKLELEGRCRQITTESLSKEGQYHGRLDTLLNHFPLATNKSEHPTQCQMQMIAGKLKNI